MKKLVHVKSLITLALCLMMCFTFFAPASTVQAKKRVVDNAVSYTHLTLPTTSRV